jgi:hypothetical protein
MVVRVVSTAAIAAAAGPPVGSVVGAPVVAAAAVRVTATAVAGAVRDNLAVAVATYGGPLDVLSVRLSLELSECKVVPTL